jgi:PAS domain S-box-containing protein
MFGASLPSRKKPVILLRFLLLASILLLSRQAGAWAIASILLVSNLVLIAIPERRFGSGRLLGGVFFFDGALITVFITEIAKDITQFYRYFMPYALTILGAALSRRLVHTFIISFIAISVYLVLALSVKTGQFLSPAEVLPWAILFYLTAVFLTFIVAGVRQERESEEKEEQLQEEAERKSEAVSRLMRLYELVTETIPSGVIIHDLDGSILLANSRALDMAGVSKEQPQEELKLWLSRIPQVEERVQQVLSGKDFSEPVDFEYETANGVRISLQHNAFHLVESGGTKYAVSFIEDVTARKAYENRVIEQERNIAKLQMLGSLSTAVVSVGSLDDICASLPDVTKPVMRFSACVILGLSGAAPRIIVRVEEKVGEKFVSQLRERLRVVAEKLSGKRVDLERVGTLYQGLPLQKDNPQPVASFIASPVVVGEETEAIIGFASTQSNAYGNEEVAFIYALANYYSLTISRFKTEREILQREAADRVKMEQLRFEKIRREAEIELAKMKLEAEEKAFAQLKKIDQMKSEFISTASHELRTPLTSIRGAVDLLVSGKVGQFSQNQQEFLYIIHRNVNRLSGLINDILDISLIESGEMELEKKICPVEPVVQEVLSSLSLKGKEKRISLRLEKPVGEINAFFDAKGIAQVLTNLLNNAIIHNPEGTSVIVQILPPVDGFVQVSVADNGRGIGIEDLPRIFERFYQGRSRQVGEGSHGTGLGLAICKEIVQRHGGKIWVTSTLGRGSDFRFTLPTTQPSREKTRLALKTSEILFGKIALLLDLVTSAQLKECVEVQERQEKPAPIGRILLEKGYITPEELENVLQIQKTNLARPWPQDPGKRLADNILGVLAVRSGPVTQEQVNECVRIQASRNASGTTCRLGEILVEKGYLTVGQILTLLSSQGKRILVCDTCGLRTNVDGYSDSKEYRCKRCAGKLTAPDNITSVIVDTTNGALEFPKQDSGEGDKI